MKKIFLALLILATSIASYAQQKNFGTKTIGQWTFEKFPLHYSVTPSKSMSYKNRITGKLELYEELNQLGQTNGLKLTMYSDGIYPSDAIYVYKGEMVYSVTFFPNSKTAQTISTYNEKGLLDGYKIYRTLKSTGGYTEEIEKYVDDVLVEVNGVKQAPVSITYKDSLLDGNFKFESSPWVIEGVAEKGKLKTIKQYQCGTCAVTEITFYKDSIRIKEPNSNSPGFSYQTLPLITNPTITNSKLFCKKYGNYNGYPYLFLSPKHFDVRDLKELVIQHFPEPLETKENYSDSLLDGDFQYRQYDYDGGFHYVKYIDVIGKAVKGKLISVSNTIVQCPNRGVKTSEKKIEYLFQDGKITQNDYIPQLPGEPVSSKTFIIEYPVLLTNSKNLGGRFYLKDLAWDHSVLNPTNILRVPYRREGSLEKNKYGYVYFSPFTFDITNYLNIVKTKKEKPVVKNTTFNNGLLDGDFEFKENRIHFIGSAKAGIIQSMKIICDFETSKDIIAPGTDWNGKTIYYDTIEILLVADTYDVSYTLSKTKTKIYQEVIPFLKNKKITNFENLSGYENFAFFRSYKELGDMLYNMKFINI